MTMHWQYAYTEALAFLAGCTMAGATAGALIALATGGRRG
jgi:hypothetical protein